MSSLKQEYKEGGMTLKDAKALAVKVLVKTLDMTKLTADKGKFLRCLRLPMTDFVLVEMATLTRTNNKTDIRILTNKEVEELIKEHEKSEAAAEAAKKEQKQKS